jgi:hypothetical protein
MCQPSLGRSGITVRLWAPELGGQYRAEQMRYRERGRAYLGLPLFRTRSEISRDYPLNLSISLSGGKETNQDSPSNGE